MEAQAQITSTVQGVCSRQVRALVWTEIAVLTSFVLSFIWVWKDMFPGQKITVIGLFIGCCGVSSWWHGESHFSRSTASRNMKKAIRYTVVFIAPIIIGTLALGAVLDSFRFPSAEQWPLRLLGGVIWGTVQQYALQAFFFRRFSDVLPLPWHAMLAGGVMFALFHLPNPFLTLVTFIAGLCTCYLYHHTKNILVLGVAHGVVSFFLSKALPIWLTGGMRVGRGYWRLIDKLGQADADLVARFWGFLF